jgi:protein-tyrosine kinase
MSLVEDALRRLRAGAGPATTTEPKVREAPRRERPAIHVTSQVYAKRHFGDPARTIHLNVADLRNAGLMPPEAQEHQLAQQYRTVKRPLIKAAFEPVDVPTGEKAKSGRSIMVSSALPGDGKTFTSLNLAMSLAKEQDCSVLLVDGDVAKPHLSRVLGAAEQEGLIDVLGDSDRPATGAVLPTSVPGLSFMPVGRRSESMTELLASVRMQRIVEELVGLDPQLLVVVDSPPILLTSEARVLASLFGQVLMVVRAGTTPQHAVLEALQILGDGAPVKFLLNEAVHNPATSYYGYGYGDEPT